MIILTKNNQTSQVKKFKERDYIRKRFLIGKVILPITRYLRTKYAEKYIIPAAKHLDIGCGDGYLLKRSICQERYGLDRLYGDDISDLPAAGAAPEWMSEKAVAIGFYFVASGVYTMIGKPLPMMGSENLHKYLTDEIDEEVGGKWAFEEDPIEAAHKMIRHIDKKRKLLKLKPMVYEQPFKVEE